MQKKAIKAHEASETNETETTEQERIRNTERVRMAKQMRKKKKCSKKKGGSERGDTERARVLQHGRRSKNDPTGDGKQKKSVNESKIELSVETGVEYGFRSACQRKT